ncbi:MAG: type IV pilin protein [Acinetobacter faecalis]|uniref:type IV pilin protein n=1 Tax=Acinetobacter faecalis TaxID=2665161 RepID=UPI003D05F2C5
MSSKLFSKGFTLVELMVVVIVIALFSLIAIPSYQAYGRKALESQVQQEMQNLAMQLERHKSRNFNYKNFNRTQVVIPTGATGDSVKYTILIRDGDVTTQILSSANNAPGRNWAIRAEAADAENYNYLMTSQGTKCKNKTKANVTFSACEAAGTEVW